ncbi:MAG TPA: VWA domain-containing protein [Terriglobales bacterium]|jgi:Ca-activated chloride channel family protein|nr:VWA domain-containing protein [Terriglobales bacterium]
MMRARTTFATRLQPAVLLLTIACGFAVGVQAQDCAMCATSEALLATAPNSWTLRKQVNEVQVLFTASRHGQFVSGLTQGDIRVRDNDNPATIVDFRGQENLPLRVVLLVDTSDSIRGRFQFEKEAAALFLRQTLRGQTDQAMVAGFNNSFHLSQDFSHDPRLLSAGIDRLWPGGGTAIYDAVAQACSMLSRPGEGVVARVLILVSDGDDNSSKSTLQAVVARAQQAEVTIYTVSTNYLGNSPADSNLKHLAQPTGGQALFPGSARKLARAFDRISEELRHRYAVSYRPPEIAANGRFHRIQVWARKSGKKLKIQARKGYYAR